MNRRMLWALLIEAIAVLVMATGLTQNEPVLTMAGVLLCLPAAELWR